MYAIQKNGPNVDCLKVARPRIQNDHDVVIQVVLAGLCRTDLYVAQGLIARAIDPLILGHEFSGIVVEVGSLVQKVGVGDRVTVMPAIPCGKCLTCLNDQLECCPHSQMLGIDLQGAFAEYISVPEKSVFKLPDDISFMMGAYMEPIAASYSVVKSGILPEQSGLIYGNNRISQLTAYVLEATNYSRITLCLDKLSEIESNSYDFVVETVADHDVMKHLVRIVKPQGRIIIKSRNYHPVGLIYNDIVRKEINLIGTNYISFDKAILLAGQSKLNKIESLWGDSHKLWDFKSVFESQESLKQFFRIS